MVIKRPSAGLRQKLFCFACLLIGATTPFLFSRELSMQQSPSFLWPSLSSSDSRRFSSPPQFLQSLHQHHSGVADLVIDPSETSPAWQGVLAHHCGVADLVIDPSETYLASAGLDGAVYIRDLRSGALISAYHHTGAVFGLAFGDQHRIVSG